MSENAANLWYRIGTIKLSKGSKTVKGISTRWATAGINQGATLRLDEYPELGAFEISSVTNDNELELSRAYNGKDLTGAKYSIDRNFQSTLNAEIAARVTSLINEYEIIREGNFITVNGKSAYEIACQHGFSGTEEEYLDSLVAGGLAAEVSSLRESMNDAGDAYEERLSAIENKLDEAGGGSVFEYLGLYVDADGDLSQDETHISQNSGATYDPNVATDDDVDAMLDEIFGD